jgi:hypothetical protein
MSIRGVTVFRLRVKCTTEGTERIEVLNALGLCSEIELGERG